MEIVAHGLWATAGVITARRWKAARLRLGWTAWWAMFPDVFAFGPMVAVGLWLRLTGQGGHGSHVHLGLPLYPMGHSLPVFLLVFGIVTLLARRVVWEMIGWLSHILIDIPTHSNSYYATRFLWPLSNFGVDGIAWWTPWFWYSTYAALALVYLILWRKGWLRRDKAAARDRAACDIGSAR
jgi:hypothetical protein